MHTIKYCQDLIGTNRTNVSDFKNGSKNGAVQISFLTPSRKMFAGKFVK